MKKQYVFSAPGRTEIGGNHTDHQNGCVLAAAVDLKATANVHRNDLDRIRIRSEGYPFIDVDLRDLTIHEVEKNTSPALVRGVAAGFAAMGIELHGFDADVTSEVIPGSGLSSSAAFEVLMGTICNHLFFEGRLSPVEIAQIGQYAENIYFGKPCGLMDQIASSIGGMVFIDFKNPDAPLVKSIDFDLTSAGYALCIIESGADHADLTEDYAAIPGELKQICDFFGKKVLRHVPKADFYHALPDIRRHVTDRAILRAIHIYQENSRVIRQLHALRSGDIATFLQLVRRSGQSSWMYLQNITPANAVSRQGTALALALCDMLLGSRGAYRIHGGGFAGTVQAFVPLDMVADFKCDMEAVLGDGSCHILSICPLGGVQEA